MHDATDVIVVVIVIAVVDKNISTYWLTCVSWFNIDFVMVFVGQYGISFF